VISDVEYLCRELLPGSVLVVTLNANPTKPIGERRKTLAAAVGEDRVPLKVTDSTLGEWGLARTQHAIYTAIVRTALAGRSDGGAWRQLLNIHYRDDARMQLIAGIVTAPAMDRTIDLCAFGDLAFVRPKDAPLVVEVPYLTPKERRALNEQLPRGRGKRLSLPGVDKAEVDAYAAVYRWLGISV
jgi:hypothetical protein